VGGAECESSDERGVVALYNTLSSLCDPSSGGDGDGRTHVQVEVTDEVDVEVYDVVALDCWSYITMSVSTCAAVLEQV